jgi:hypothetical protein
MILNGTGILSVPNGQAVVPGTSVNVSIKSNPNLQKIGFESSWKFDQSALNSAFYGLERMLPTVRDIQYLFIVEYLLFIEII